MQKRTFMAPKLDWKSKEFLEGYNYQGPRHMNPYKNLDTGHPHGDAIAATKRNDWDHGWLTRFYGETI